jgi:putative MATE family efflux protein
VKLSLSGVRDMTQGNPYKLIFAFSIPLLIGNVFQQLYNMVDSIVVGNYVGTKALAAVGTGFPIIFMLSSLFIGIGTGTTIMISQYFGARDMENLENTVNTVYTAMILGCIPLTVLGIVSSGPLLHLMNVPDDGTFEMAKTYMIVIFAGIIGTVGYNINAGILQGLGDSHTSLLFLLIATIINIVLDLLFTIVFGWGVFGVAFATIISEFCSWVFGISFINKHYSFININVFRFRFDGSLFKKAMKLGIPSGVQQALFSVGIMVMQALVNSYGSDFMAGFNGANKIDTFAFMPIQSFATAITTYVGQNVGASKLERVKSGTKAGFILAVGSSIIICAIIYPLSPLLMRMFSQETEVILSGVAYLHCVLPFYLLLAMLFIVSAVLKGAGEMMVPMIATFISLWFARVPTAYLIADLWGKEYIYYSYAVGWFLGFVIAFVYYKSGKWKNKSIIDTLPKTEL